MIIENCLFSKKYYKYVIICNMKKHTMWIVELLIWGVLIFSALFASFYVYNLNVRKHYTYYVFFHDVDGLIKGSPVKLQGYQIGYVSNISIVNDEVFVTFVITDRDFNMPKEMSATVEFTGMGGSKSLDLRVEKSSPGSESIITTIEPRRLQDFYIYGNQIAQNIVFVTSDFMKLFDEKRLGQIKAMVRNPVFLEETDLILDKWNKGCSDLRKRLEKR